LAHKLRICRSVSFCFFYRIGLWSMDSKTRKWRRPTPGQPWSRKDGEVGQGTPARCHGGGGDVGGAGVGTPELGSDLSWVPYYDLSRDTTVLCG